MIFVVFYTVAVSALVARSTWQRAVRHTELAEAQKRWVGSLNRIAADYAGMASAAAANDEFAYEQQLRAYWLDEGALGAAGSDLLGDGSARWRERSQTESEILNCAPIDVIRFHMQTPDHLAACHNLLTGQSKQI